MPGEGGVGVTLSGSTQETAGCGTGGCGGVMLGPDDLKGPF